jgi:hypothetical protein
VFADGIHHPEDLLDVFRHLAKFLVVFAPAFCSWGAIGSVTK